ncbi:hypothetical protein VNO77_33865 [Canavalia gladiata]|uniref:Uncharacterized protein n=1 Tax=Canavalia gladiata TaxID=3824 RepID=A0AAN9KCM8_CANGL
MLPKSTYGRPITDQAPFVMISDGVHDLHEPSFSYLKPADFIKYMHRNPCLCQLEVRFCFNSWTWCYWWTLPASLELSSSFNSGFQANLNLALQPFGKCDLENSVAIDQKDTKGFKLSWLLHTRESLLVLVMVASRIADDSTGSLNNVEISMARPLPVINPLSNTSHIGLAVMTLMVCAIALLMCASHSRKLREWISCYDVFVEETVIEHNNEAVMSGNEQQEEVDSLWQKKILMGGKCELPDFSGVIIYDSNGNIVNPAKNSRPLLTWK